MIDQVGKALAGVQDALASVVFARGKLAEYQEEVDRTTDQIRAILSGATVQSVSMGDQPQYAVIPQVPDWMLNAKPSPDTPSWMLANAVDYVRGLWVRCWQEQLKTGKPYIGTFPTTQDCIDYWKREEADKRASPVMAEVSVFNALMRIL